MGRALFSHYISSEPVVRSQSPPAPPSNDFYGTWSVWNNFDPDSDEFFDGAQYEAFIEPGQPSPPPPAQQSIPHLEDPDSSESSSEGGDNDRGSPMAVGSDDPVDMIARAYSRSWDLTPEESRYALQRPLDGPANAYMPLPQAPTRVRAPVPDDAPSLSTSRARIQSTTDTPVAAVSDPAVPLIPFATPSISPIDIPVERRIPHAVGTPSPSRFHHGSPSNDFTPSPAPAFTPRIYNWNRIPDPSSPTPASRLSVSGSVSPVSRMTLPRVTPIRVQGFTVAT
jgi:hypothetical protein